MESYVYFIQEENNGPIKIGVAQDPVHRLKCLQISNPRSLSILTTVKGFSKQETSIHKKFSNCRIRGEWFFPSPDLMNFIDQINSGFVDFDQEISETKHFVRQPNPFCDDIIESFAPRAKALGVSMQTICKSAGISVTTYYRWKMGKPAMVNNVEHIDKFISAMESGQ